MDISLRNRPPISVQNVPLCRSDLRLLLRFDLGHWLLGIDAVFGLLVSVRFMPAWSATLRVHIQLISPSKKDGEQTKHNGLETNHQLTS